MESARYAAREWRGGVNDAMTSIGYGRIDGFLIGQGYRRRRLEIGFCLRQLGCWDGMGVKRGDMTGLRTTAK